MYEVRLGLKLTSEGGHIPDNNQTFFAWSIRAKTASTVDLNPDQMHFNSTAITVGIRGERRRV